MGQTFEMNVINIIYHLDNEIIADRMRIKICHLHTDSVGGRTSAQSQRFRAFFLCGLGLMPRIIKRPIFVINATAFKRSSQVFLSQRSLWGELVERERERESWPATLLSQ